MELQAAYFLWACFLCSYNAGDINDLSSYIMTCRNKCSQQSAWRGASGDVTNYYYLDVPGPLFCLHSPWMFSAPFGVRDIRTLVTDLSYNLALQGL